MKIFSLHLLLKNRGFVFLFLALSIFAGFSLPSIEQRELITRALVSKVIPLPIGIIILILAIIVNFYIVHNSMKPKYAIEVQAKVASLLLIPLLSILSYFGLWLRIKIQFLTPELCQINNLPICQPIPQLPPMFLSDAIALTFSLTIFNLVYSTALGPSSSVNYVKFHQLMKNFISDIYYFKNFDVKNNIIIINERKITKLTENLTDIITNLQENIVLDSYYYRGFARVFLLEPLLDLKSFFLHDIKNSPEILLELLRENPIVTNEKIEKNRAHLIKLKILFPGENG